MTELETMQRAKMYMDKLARGIDPITNQEISDDSVLNNVRDGSIVLMHDIKGYTVDAIEDIIKWGLDNGYTFKVLTASSPTFHHRVQN